MILDSFFSIGKNHKICEDYITVGYNPVPYIVVSDGCSSSENSDVGARILSWSAVKALQSLYNRNNVIPFEYNALAYTIIAMARSQADALGLPKSATDATIVLAFYHKEHIWVYMYGDGVIMLKLTDGSIDYYSVKCDLIEDGLKRERPYYLSYLVNPYRNSLYNDTVITYDTEGTIKSIYNSIRQDNTKMRYDAQIIRKFPLSEYDVVAIGSDGIDTFTDNSKGIDGKLSLDEVVPLFINFKTTKGEFVKRRAKKQIQAFHKSNISHIDDFSLGAFTELQPKDA